MFHTPTDLGIKGQNKESYSRPLTRSLLPDSVYLVRSNLPGLCFEIEKPDAELPLVTFNFDAEAE